MSRMKFLLSGKALFSGTEPLLHQLFRQKAQLRDHENDHEGHREDQHHPRGRPERADVIEAGEDDQTQNERSDTDSEDAPPVPVEGP